MVIYLARCIDCAEEYEVTSRDAISRPCQRCKGPLRRVYALGGVSFKGSGFYVNDKNK